MDNIGNKYKKMIFFKGLSQVVFETIYLQQKQGISNNISAILVEIGLKWNFFTMSYR
jgi:hypothetical protein